MFDCLNKKTKLVMSLTLWILTFSLPTKTHADLKKLQQIDNFLTSKHTNSVSALEQRINIFLQTKKSPKNTITSQLESSEPLTQADLFYLTKVWDKLDKRLLNAYVNSLNIPDSMNKYISPGKHFEVYYSSEPIKSYLQNDNYGFDTLNNWRLKINGPNGIPDYVDEIAWALDSSWSLEVERFGFQKPIPLTEGSHNSPQYKVIAINSSDYGFTYPVGKSPNQQGWASYIEINTNFESLNGYSSKPEDAIRVTCAHEFFHAIQFAMTWNVVEYPIQLDDFPIAWLEGTATAMEDLAFPYINDYLQYSFLYFSSPGTEPFYNDNISKDLFLYTNSLLSLYLYNYTKDTPGIYFIYTMLYNHFTSKIPFSQNLRSTSASFGTTWTDLLNNFYVSSFFTGINADTNRFLPDAPLFDTLFYTQDSSISSTPIQKTISPYSMRIFTYQSSSIQSDTLLIHLRHVSTNDNSLDMPWAATAILRKKDSNTTIPISLNNNGDGNLTVTNWAISDQILVFVTNGDPSQAKDFSITFDNCPITHDKNENFTVDAIAGDRKSKASIEVSSKTALRCDLTLTASPQQRLIDNAKLTGLQPISSIFSLNIPVTWESGADMKFTISIPDQADTINKGIYRWDNALSKWHLINATTMSLSKDTLKNIIDNVLSGEYAVFQSDVPVTISMYPNPISLRQKSICFEGALISNIYIFNVNGILVYKSNKETGNLTTKWNLTNSYSKAVSPGYYLAVIKFYDPSTGSFKTIHKKLMVAP